MNAERTVVSTHKLVTTPQIIRFVTSSPRSSGSSEVHWNASKRTLSTFRSSGRQSSSATMSASHDPAASPFAVSAGLSLIRAGPWSALPIRYR
jgi:hypothetical protein